MKPIAYWRLGDLTADVALDSIGMTHALYGGAIALQLDGEKTENFAAEVNRCVYFAGGTLNAKLPDLPKRYSVCFAFWSGLPADGRGQVGTLFQHESTDALSITASENPFARLSFKTSVDQQIGPTPLGLKAWHHVLIVCEQGRAVVYLDGKRELQCKRTDTVGTDLTFGEFDGKLDEVAVFDRALSTEEAAKLPPRLSCNHRRAPHRVRSMAKNRRIHRRWIAMPRWCEIKAGFLLAIA